MFSSTVLLSSFWFINVCLKKKHIIFKYQIFGYSVRTFEMAFTHLPTVTQIFLFYFSCFCLRSSNLFSNRQLKSILYYALLRLINGFTWEAVLKVRRTFACHKRYFWTFTNSWIYTAWKVSIFGVILVCIFPHSDWIQRDKDCRHCQVHCVNTVHIRNYFGPHFPAFGLSTERYSVSLRI